MFSLSNVFFIKRHFYFIKNNVIFCLKQVLFRDSKITCFIIAVPCMLMKNDVLNHGGVRRGGLGSPSPKTNAQNFYGVKLIYVIV